MDDIVMQIQELLLVASQLQSLNIMAFERARHVTNDVGKEFIQELPKWLETIATTRELELPTQSDNTKELQMTMSRGVYAVLLQVLLRLTKWKSIKLVQFDVYECQSRGFFKSWDVFYLKQSRAFLELFIETYNPITVVPPLQVSTYNLVKIKHI